MNHKPIIIGIGEVLFDIFPDSRQMGGAPVNFVYHASRLGAEGYAVTAIGDDDNGREILSVMDSAGLDYIAETVPFPTGTVMVELDKAGIPTYTITENVAWDNIPLTAPMLELAGRADAVCFGTLAQRSPVTRGTIREVLAAVPEDAYRVFDINFRQDYFTRDTIIGSMRLANILKINHEELGQIKQILNIDAESEADICRWIGERFDMKMIVLTAGDSHSSIYTRDETSTIETPRVKVVDTVGAGDAFTGALISSLLAGSSLVEAHRFAVEKSAFACTQPGAWTDYSV